MAVRFLGFYMLEMWCPEYRTTTEGWETRATSADSGSRTSGAHVAQRLELMGSLWTQKLELMGLPLAQRAD